MLATAFLFLVTATPHGVSFAQARSLAHDRAPELALANLRTQLAQADVRIAGAFSNPTLSLSSSTQAARAGAGISVPLPIFGQRAKAIDAAEADAQVASLEVEVVRREARWSTTIAWLELWEAQSRRQLLEAAAVDARRVLDIASEKLAAGTGARVDMLRTRADNARATAEVETATHAIDAAAARLAPLVGAEPSEPILAAGAPGYPEQLPPIATVEQSLSAHPTLERDRQQVVASERHISAEQRARWPIVNGQFTVLAFDPTLPTTEYVFGLSFDLPVLSLRGGAVERARAQRQLAEASANNDQRRLRSEILDAFDRVQGNSARRDAFRTQVLPDLEEARALTEEGYRIGRLELLRVLEAQRALLEGRLAALDAAAAWARAVADFERAANLSFEEPDHAL